MAGKTEKIGAPTVRFPVLLELDVDGFALYPGSKASPGLHVLFSPGLTLVLGANGLGKTTLVWILYRMLAGPYEIPRIDDGADLGGRSLEPRELTPSQARLFAERVSDNAKSAVATLKVALGDATLSVTRSLKDLSLQRFSIDGVTFRNTDESSFQEEICRLAGVWSFGDWILLLRYITFYFEDRRALVWDASAQRQILRLLLLPSETAREWSELERKVLEIDSRYRNLTFSLSKEEDALARDVSAASETQDVAAQIQALADLQSQDEARRNELQDSLDALDARRKKTRLALMRAEQEREAAFRAVEHARLELLISAFPSVTETAKYILSQLMSKSHCLVCDHEVPRVAENLNARIAKSRCVICGSSTTTHNASKGELKRLVAGLERADNKLKDSSETHDEATAKYESLVNDIAQKEAAIAQRRETISDLAKRLPPDQAELRKRSEELVQLRARLAALKEELATKRRNLTSFVTRVRGSVLEFGPRIKDVFERYAGSFLMEQCQLTWDLVKMKVGQSGSAIEFPAFEFDMASAVFDSPVRRTGPDNVSESQREFIDLSFRMALMEVACPTSGGSLVVDAPESSLDAVFVARAADVLVQFGGPKSANRLVVTSNLTEGILIKRLLRSYPNRAGRIVDLFTIAEPTAAVRHHQAEYDQVRAKLLGGKPTPSNSGSRKKKRRGWK